MLQFKKSNIFKNIFKVKELSKDFYKLEVVGKYGKLEKLIKRDINLSFKEDIILIDTSVLTKKYKALKFTITSIINNLILDINYGFSVILEVRGVGLKLDLIQNNTLVLHLGLSHPVYYKLPSDVLIKFLDPKNNIFLVTGVDRQKVYQTALKIKSLKKKDNYKGKGIFFFGERFKLKEGKAKAP